MARLGYNLANASFDDYQADAKFFEDLRLKAGFPFISTNVVKSGTKEPYLQPYLIVDTAGGYKVAFLGISRASAKPVAVGGASLIAMDPTEAVKRYLPEIRPKVHVVVILANLPYSEAQALATTCPGIDLILAGDGNYLTFEPQFVNDSYILYGGEEGKYVGVIDAYPSGNVVDKLGCRIVALDKTYADDDEMAGVLEAYSKEVQSHSPGVVRFQTGGAPQTQRH